LVHAAATCEGAILAMGLPDFEITNCSPSAARSTMDWVVAPAYYGPGKPVCFPIDVVLFGVRSGDADVSTVMCDD